MKGRNRRRKTENISEISMPIYLRMKKMEFFKNMLKSPLSENGAIQNHHFIDMVSDEDLKPIADKIIPFACKIEHSCSNGGEYINGEQSAREFLEHIQGLSKTKIPLYKEIKKLFDTKCLDFEMASVQACHFRKKILELERNFGLTQNESEVITFAYLYTVDVAVRRFIDCAMNVLRLETRRSNLLVNLMPIISIITGVSRDELLKACGKKSSLNRLNLWVSDELAEEVISFLNGMNENPLSDTYFKQNTDEALPIESHIVDEKHMKVLQELLTSEVRKGGVNILLYGEPGTGKTELVRSLCRSLNKKLYEVAHIVEDEYYCAADFRYRAVLVCQRMIDPEDSVILIDEADGILNTNAGSYFIASENQKKKGLLNCILDESNATRIWITNHYNQVDTSTMRRFDYSLEFMKPGHSQRAAIWRTSLEKHGMNDFFKNEDIEKLADRYEVSAGGIEVVMRNIQPTMNQKEALERTDTLLRAHIKITNGQAPLNSAEANAKNYSLEGINIKQDLSEVLETLKAFNSHWKGERFEAGSVRNMNMLLFGPPGGGKTEFAKYVGRKLERRIIQKRGSDLLSMWVGGTEKLIREAFDEAEREGAILFIDEADGLLGSREKAVRNWEMSQANELLSGMESLKGMLICATNFRNGLDPASIRRFNLKLEFDYLKPEGNMSFYNRVLGDISAANMTEDETSEVLEITCLTPGDFKVVWQKFAFREPVSVSHRALIDALREEVGNKEWILQKRIGF